MKPNSSSIE